MDKISRYWNKKFKDEKEVWGNEPSESAIKTMDLFERNHLNTSKILDVACGYGRDSVFFASKHHKVTGIDISSEGISMARNKYPDINFVVGNITELPFPNLSFDAVFGNFILHLFLKDTRAKIISESLRVTKPGGLVIFSVASVDDNDFGLGVEKEKNYFVNSRGVTKYYYSKETICEEFKNFKEVIIEEIEEHHQHDHPHTHKSYVIYSKKEGAENDNR